MRGLACSLALSLCGGAAFAASPATVRVVDLDLATASGAATALQRIETAAKTFCGVRKVGNTRVADAQVLRCRRQLTDDTVRRLSVPSVRVLRVWGRSPADLAPGVRADGLGGAVSPEPTAGT